MTSSLGPIFTAMGHTLGRHA